MHCNTNEKTGEPIEDVSTAVASPTTAQWGLFIANSGVSIIPCRNNSDVCRRDLSCFGPGTTSAQLAAGPPPPSSSPSSGVGGAGEELLQVRCHCTCLAAAAGGGGGGEVLLQCGPRLPQWAAASWSAGGWAFPPASNDHTQGGGAKVPPAPPTPSQNVSVSNSLTRTAGGSTSPSSSPNAGSSASASLSETLLPLQPPVSFTESLTSSATPLVVYVLATKERSITAYVSFALNGNEAAATGVTAAGTSSAALTGLTSTTALTQVGKVNGISAVLGCVFDEDDARPSHLEVPLQVPLGNSSMKWFTGSVVLSSSVLIVVPLGCHGGMHFYIDRYRPLRTTADAARSARALKFLRSFGMAFIVCFSFVVGGVVQSSVTAIRFGDSNDVALCVFLGILPSMVGCAWLSYGVWRSTSVIAALQRKMNKKQKKKSKSSVTTEEAVECIRKQLGRVKSSNRQQQGDASDDDSDSDDDGTADHSGKLFVVAFAPAVDSVRSLTSRFWLWSVLPFDIAVSIVVAVISGRRPSTPEACRGSAIALLIVAIGNWAAHIAFRPYGAKKETAFAVAHATLLLMLAIAVVCSLKVSAAADEGADNKWIRAFGWTSFIQMVAFPVQAVVEFGFHVYRTYTNTTSSARRRALDDDSSEMDSGSGGGGTFATPLLDVPVPSHNADTAVRRSGKAGTQRRKRPSAGGGSMHGTEEVGSVDQSGGRTHHENPLLDVAVPSDTADFDNNFAAGEK